jgi:D-alanyl-D-alanine carboxypeptidase
MSMRGFAIAAAVMAASWGFSALTLIDPELLGSNSETAAPVHRPATSAKERRHDRRSPFAVRAAAGPPPVEVDFAHPPRAGILFDVETGRVLWQRHPGRRLPIASLTKMMTALIIAERHRLGERVAITPEALAYQGSGMGVLTKGERVPLRDLLYGLLLVSGNDAAIALAQHDAGSVPSFVERMNLSARRLGLRCSRFSSPSGILDRGNYSCPRDLAALARADLANARVRRLVGADHVRFPFPVKGGHLDLYNNNPFIREGTKGITGVKTGYTEAAGRCYVITRRFGGRQLGVVLLDTSNPLDQVPALLRAGANAERRP